MSTVRAKFTCQSKTETKYSDAVMVTINLSPVMGNDANPENKVFWQYTPTGSISLGTVNKSAGDVFELGKSYYVDFTPADAP